MLYSSLAIFSVIISFSKSDFTISGSLSDLDPYPPPFGPRTSIFVPTGIGLYGILDGKLDLLFDCSTKFISAVDPSAPPSNPQGSYLCPSPSIDIAPSSRNSKSLTVPKPPRHLP